MNAIGPIFLLLWGVVVLYFWVRKDPYLDGHYKPGNSDSRTKVNVEWFKAAFEALKKPDVKHKEMGFVGGELNPAAYSEVKDDFEEALRNGVKFNIVFGPRIAIEDKHKDAKLPDSDMPLSQVHPVFELYSKYSDQIKLGTPKDGIRHEVHSAYADDNVACIEDTHFELDERGANYYYDNKHVTSDIRETILSLINDSSRTDIVNLDTFRRDRLVTVSELQQEKVSAASLSDESQLLLQKIEQLVDSKLDRALSTNS